MLCPIQKFAQSRIGRPIWNLRFNVKSNLNWFTIVKLVYIPSLGKTSEAFSVREKIKQKMPKSPRNMSPGERKALRSKAWSEVTNLTRIGGTSILFPTMVPIFSTIRFISLLSTFFLLSDLNSFYYVSAFFLLSITINSFINIGI